ncbi:helix-turn-helix domain-containing protein [Streptococcus mutans]|uniref:helix-turn-helix domain-containing protein n=1 Tax=Streptococcus mutans TaxID=1309 RepID=UPI000B5439F1|nr:helix-turn-helix transcriptional regulator [Streptococcus mutans]MDO8139589.1 helix-turn-helix transcriptional regulator [Streptococcus mutans]
MINKQFCDLLALFLVEIKKKFGITAKLLTDELNLSKNTLTNWKKGAYKPNGKLSKRFLNYLIQFKNEQYELISKDDTFYNLIEELIEVLSDELNSLLERSNSFDRNFEERLLKDRKKNFQKSFTNFIEFLSKVARLYDLEYENATSNYLKTRDYQKKEVFDNLLALKLINKNKRGTFSIQKNLAKLLNVSQAQISRWKKGIDYPSSTNFKKIGELCNYNSDAPLAIYEFKEENFESMFLKSPMLSYELRQFEYEYLEKIKLFIEKSGYNKILESKIKQDDYLILYENEDLEEARNKIYTDCIMLLWNAFTSLNITGSFKVWLFQKIRSKELTKLMYGTIGYQLEEVSYCNEFAREVDDGYKFLRNYLIYDGSFDLVQMFVLENKTLFVLAKVFVESLESQGRTFEEWFEETVNRLKQCGQEGLFRHPCSTICTSLNKRNHDNSLDYLEAFYKQLKNLINEKSSPVGADTLSPDKRCLAEIGEEGVWDNLQRGYLLLNNILKQIYKEQQGIVALYWIKDYLGKGEKVFKEVLFNNCTMEFNKKYNSSGYDFEIINEMRRLHNEVSAFQNKWS